ncbi:MULTISPECIES: tetratricopeptide repeat-containing diguanylate cyclase [Shewanella]|uniref:diguanylate cyclase n=1 Tax=Shewanella japonica TaxID=93973 RepID=A0ABM6JGS2_9GAMM|nr:MULTISPECIES: GGDEF domain-containing protein [Shewanella]ARD21324.1 GGDEF domain-containing protein [Shewanella japonica]MBQ4891500.1 GGDEF domain-containing protein [Shewanella sp. MMG014]
MPKFIVALIIFISFITPSWGDEIRSIDFLLEKASENRSSDADEFNKLMEELKTFESNLSRIQNDEYSYLLAYQMAFRGDFVGAQTIWEQLSVSGQTINIQFKANISLINTMALSKEWNKGLGYLEKNIELMHLITDSELSQLGVSVTSYFYNKIGQYELGLDYATKLDNLFLNGRNLCVAKHQIVESKFYLKKLQLNSADFKTAIDACSIGDEPVWLSAIQIYKARLMLENNDFKSALNVLNSNVEEIERIHYIPIQSLFYALLAKTYQAENDDEKAREFALQAIELTKGMSNTDSEVIAYNVLFQSSVNDSDYESALRYYIKFAEAEKSYFDDLKTKYLAFQLAQHKAVEQKVQIELLNKQNKLLQASQRLAESETENNRLFMALLIMVISLLSLASIRAKQTQKRLKRLAQYDSLTQIFNRGHFTSAAQEAITACQKNQDTISCILFDLDNFKGINDKHGHGCGDWVLKHVASTCDDLKRKQDIFARIGGEEFCVVLSNCNAEMAMNIAEDYRKAIAALDSSPSGYEFPISASFGVTDSQQSDYSLEALTSNADSAMYLAKHTGRNRVCNYADVESAKDADGVMI